MMIESFLPLQRSPADHSFFIVVSGLLNFTLEYFHFWPSLACTLLQTVVYFVCQNMYTDTPIGILSALLALVQVTLYLTMTHMIVTKVGFIFVHAESVNEGNEQLLNNLDEGVVILDKQDKNIIFVNKRAKHFDDMNITIRSDDKSEKSEKEDVNLLDQTMQDEVFAPFDLQRLVGEESATEPHKFFKEIQATNNYISLKKIVENASKANFPKSA